MNVSTLMMIFMIRLEMQSEGLCNHAVRHDVSPVSQSDVQYLRIRSDQSCLRALSRKH